MASVGNPEVRKGGPQGPEGEPFGDNEEARRALQFRQEGYAEIASKLSPEEVLHYTRMYTGTMERLWFDFEQQPNTYQIGHFV